MRLRSCCLCLCGVLVMALRLDAAVSLDNLSGDEWVATHAKIAEELFAEWKATGKLPEDFDGHAVKGERADLIERVLASDHLADTEIKPTPAVVSCEVTVRDHMPMVSTCGDKGPSSFSSLWRRITKDRFEIWTPTEGRLYDADGKLLVTAKVRRGDGWGREWYGAFLPDGNWVTTDLNERDDKLSLFSPTGKRSWSISGKKLIPANGDSDTYPSLPLIAWARSARDGKGWVVSVGSEFGRGWVKVTQDGNWTKVACPWKECFPQQLGPRGMYTCKNAMSDDGKISITRNEPSHGTYVGWPVYDFPNGDNARIPSGEMFGVLPDAWAVFIESNHSRGFGLIENTSDERMKERVWFFDTTGKFQHWIKGHSAGTSLAKGGLWVVLADDSCLRVDKEYTAGSLLKFTTAENQSLIPLEIHDDIGLGLFRQNDQLVLGSWKTKR